MKEHEHNFTLDADDLNRCIVCGLTTLQAMSDEEYNGLPSKKAILGREVKKIRAARKNAARRARHAAMTDIGLKRVRGALGGVYYE